MSLRLLSRVTRTLLLSAVGSISYGADPFGVSPPSGKQWTITFEDEFTQDSSIDTNKWNGGAESGKSVRFHRANVQFLVQEESAWTNATHFIIRFISSLTFFVRRTPIFLIIKTLQIRIVHC